MVIINHEADILFNRAAEPLIGVYILEQVSHMAVPCFLMLTGAFVIDRTTNIAPRDFYIRSFKKLGVPTILFIVLYWALLARDVSTVVDSLRVGFHRYYAHWYVVMLAGIYAFIPLVSYVRQRVYNTAYRKACIVYFIWAILSRWMEGPEASWTLSNVGFFMGYVLMGDLLRTRLDHMGQNNLRATGVFLAGNAMLIINAFILYHHVMNGGGYYDRFYNMYSAPLIVVASMLLFCAFGSLKVRYSALATYIAAQSFVVFLCHKLVLVALTRMPVLGRALDLDGIAFVVAVFVLVFAISFAIAVLYNSISKALR